MTITLEPVVRRSTISGKEAIAIAQSVPQPPPTTTRPDQPLASTPAKATNLLQNFIESFKEVDSYRNGSSILVDGYNLSVPAVTAAARYNAPVTLDDSAGVRERLQQSRDVIVSKMSAGKSVYGVSTGYGGSADTRTDDPLRLGSALLQHQHYGVISTEEGDSLPLLDPLNNTAMPESWVRGAILIRMNSLIRGHSGVRVELIQQMGHLLREQITPLVPLRGSISASGDLSPLSYIAGTLIGNPSIRTVCRSSKTRQILPSNKALAQHNIQPISLQSKEHLGILNGTAFSASVASLALNDAVHLALLAQILTAMGVESLLGTQASFDSFIHDECRPHPGQVEVARTVYNLLEGSSFATGADHEEEEANIDEDKGVLRQDRYPLRTSPQFLGPQVEDILSALDTITLECNSTTDNPLIDGKTGTIHHGGNFQAMAVTNAMEKTRLALHHIGKLLFAQATELMNPAMNRGLPPNLAASDPSLNYHTKGVDIGMAAYVSELGYLATPVSTHIQSAEMHNQAINSLALISGRATINAIDTLTILMSSYLYALCQALDLRALQAEFSLGITKILQEELVAHFGSPLIYGKLFKTIVNTLDESTTMDCTDRMKKVAEACTAPLVNHSLATPPLTLAIANIPLFRTSLASRLTALYNQLTNAFLEGAHGPAPASKYLKKTRAVYEYVRTELKIKMHGKENFERFDHVGIDGLVGMPGGDDETIGQNITRIYEAIRDGKLQAVVVDTFAN
jgi:phenylalanine ammonia-lyase